MNPNTLADIIDTILEANKVPESGGIIQIGTSGTVTKLGLALDWDNNTAAWAAAHNLDGIWLHRLARGETAFPENLAVLCHHAAFDRRFGLACNSTLHQELGTATFKLLSDRPALAIIRLKLPIHQRDLAGVLRDRFGGIERTYGYGTRLTILALADAMHAELLQAASSAGAELYLTGQWRPNAEATAEELGLSIITVGHGPIEQRGLQDLATLIQPGLPGTTIVIKE